MIIRLKTVAPLLLFSSLTFGNQNSYVDQEVDFGSPEGWGMAFMTTSSQNLGQVPPHSVNVKDISISAELSSIPRLSKEQQKIGFGGFKDEDLNKSPAFGRIRASIGLPWDLNAEISWTPPIQINNSKPDNLWGAAVSKPIINNEKIGLGLRLFLVRGGAIASVTCSEDNLNFDLYTPQNTAGCIALSDDKLKMDHEGIEIFLSLTNSSAILPWISLASSNLDNSVEINAPLEVGRERATVYSSGTTQTISFGFTYDFNEDWSFNASSSYTPLDVRRPNYNSGNDNFWNVRFGLTMKY
tara:strand:+ start:1607 stop:2500 length:894 start_codon:yes stop_codon:yes gene_type:complete